MPEDIVVASVRGADSIRKRMKGLPHTGYGVSGHEPWSESIHSMAEKVLRNLGESIHAVPSSKKRLFLENIEAQIQLWDAEGTSEYFRTEDGVDTAAANQTLPDEEFAERQGQALELCKEGMHAAAIRCMAEAILSHELTYQRESRRLESMFKRAGEIYQRFEQAASEMYFHGYIDEADLFQILQIHSGEKYPGEDGNALERSHVYSIFPKTEPTDDEVSNGWPNYEVSLQVALMKFFAGCGFREKRGIFTQHHAAAFVVALCSLRGIPVSHNTARVRRGLPQGALRPSGKEPG